MRTPPTMKDLQPSDFIAIIALLTSFASVFFAQKSKNAAEKANNINLHSHQKTIYHAFYELKMHIEIKGEFAEIRKVSKYYYQGLDAKFYFNQEIAEQFKKFFDLCFEIADISRVEGRTKTERDEARNKLNCAREIANELDGKIIKKITLL